MLYSRENWDVREIFGRAADGTWGVHGNGTHNRRGHSTEGDAQRMETHNERGCAMDGDSFVKATLLQVLQHILISLTSPL